MCDTTLFIGYVYLGLCELCLRIVFAISTLDLTINFQVLYNNTKKVVQQSIARRPLVVSQKIKRFQQVIFVKNKFFSFIALRGVYIWLFLNGIGSNYSKVGLLKYLFIQLRLDYSLKQCSDQAYPPLQRTPKWRLLVVQYYIYFVYLQDFYFVVLGL